PSMLSPSIIFIPAFGHGKRRANSVHDAFNILILLYLFWLVDPAYPPRRSLCESSHITRQLRFVTLSAVNKGMKVRRDEYFFSA
ncbi:hypothetical protein ACXWRQ_005252, partial [Klebsiella pneumoniae]